MLFVAKNSGVIYLLQNYAHQNNLEPSSMKNLLLLLILVFSLTTCKKAVQRSAEDAIVVAMVNGQWAITNFVQNGTNHTADFNNYKFQYYSNKTVDAIKNGTIEQTGNWDGNAATMTTSANFPVATTPLNLINGDWHIDNNSWTFVIASQINSTETKTMRLDKQ